MVGTAGHPTGSMGRPMKAGGELHGIEAKFYFISVFANFSTMADLGYSPSLPKWPEAAIRAV